MTAAVEQVPAQGADVTAAVRQHAATWLESTVTEAGIAVKVATRRRHAAARSRWLGPRLAEKLARSSSEKLRATVADNPACPSQLLTRLTQDRKLAVRAFALANPSVPYSVVTGHVEGQPLRHPECPTETVAAAARSSDTLTVLSALQHPNLPADVRAAVLAATSGVWWEYRNLLLENASCTHAEALALICETEPGGHRDPRRLWATHPAADPQWLADLAADAFRTRPALIADIAANPATPGATLTRILRHHSQCDPVMSNPSCPPEELVAEVVHGAAAAGSDGVKRWRERRTRIAGNPASSASVLAHLRVGDVPGDSLFAFTATHARTGPQAHMVLRLADSWAGSLRDLLEAAEAVAAAEATEHLVPDSR